MSDREVTQQAEPVSHAVIAGALFDFMAWLTTRKERITLSAADDASPAADAIKVFAEMRGLSLDDARVQDWQNYTTPPQQQAEPVRWDKPSASFDEWWDGDRRRDNANPFQTDSFAYWAFEGWQAALAQPVQEPLAWLYPEGLKALQNGKCWTAYPTQHEDCNTPLYIAMPPIIEAKLKELNHG